MLAHGGALEIVASKKSCSSPSLRNKLQGKLTNMLSAHLSKKGSNVASMLGKDCAMRGGSKEGCLRGECKRKPCTNGMWCQEKVVAANGALLLHLPLQNHGLGNDHAAARVAGRGVRRAARRSIRMRA